MTRAPVTGCITNKFHLLIGINAERALPVFHGPQAFAARATAVAIADDDPQFYWCPHFYTP
jgi:hypothetical protein